jgi:hypothetical protein
VAKLVLVGWSSEALSVEDILHQAEHLEKEYEWLRAADSYERTLGLLPQDDFSGKGETFERLGYAFHRAAFQAETNEEFRQRLRQAVAAYEKAKEHYQKLIEPKKKGIVFRCDAMNAYIGYWLAHEASEKRRLVSECWALTKASLKSLSESGLGLEYGKTYNRLSSSALLSYCLEWNYQARKGIMKEAMEHGEAAIQFLARTDETNELARAYAKTSFCLSLLAYYFVDLDERDSVVRKAQQYWSKAKATCEDSAGPEMLSPVQCAHDLLWGEASEEALTSINRALENSRKAKDRFLIGSALDWLAYHTGWTVYSTDDPDEFVEVRRKVIQYAEEAKRQYSTVSFISPRADAFWIEVIHAEPSLFELRFETDSQKKRSLYEKALDTVKGVQKLAESSGYQTSVWWVQRYLGLLFRSLAGCETNSELKKGVLEESFQHGVEALKLLEQMEPLGCWDRGVHHAWLASVKWDLAWLSEDSEVQRKMVEEALAEQENALKLLMRYMEYQPEKRLVAFGVIGSWQYEMGRWLSRLHGLTHNSEHLKRAAEVFNEAADSFHKTRITSRVAECHWKAAQAYDGLSQRMKSAESFSLASNNFRSAVEKVPQLKGLYEQHAVYMEAWSEIEKARHFHERQEYGLAREHFEKAADLHKPLKQWGYLASNYSAWANVECAEDLSRNERCEEAIQAFEQALKLFDETKESIQNELNKIEDSDEKQMATGMMKASDLRCEYCTARIALEEARILDKKGDHYSSSEKYGSAAETFVRIGQKQESEQEKREIHFIATLSHAWQKMTLAEAEASPALYAEASDVFEKSRDCTPNEKTKMLVLGHSRFCKALEAGTRFADTRDQALHDLAVQHLASASNYYIKADLQTASEYAKATKLLFDAYLYTDNAEREADPEKKAKLYVMIERILQTSAGSYTKAKHPEKREQMLKLLEKAKEEQELAASMTEALHGPSIVSATTAFASPTPTKEQAVGSERFEHADVQANLIVRRKEVKVGEPLSLMMELVNAGKAPATLIKVNEVIPEGFELGEKPETYRVEDSYIDMKGKRLGFLKTVELGWALKPKTQGTFALKPTVLYIDENGSYKTHEIEPVTVTVKELGIKGWLKGER